MGPPCALANTLDSNQRQGTYVVRVERLPVRRILQQEAFEPQDLAHGLLRERRQDVNLEVVDVVVADRLLEDPVELVQDLDPRV